MAKDKDKSKKKKSSDAEKSVKKSKKKGELKLGSLAVEYRPKTIHDLVGQDHIVTQLKGMFKSGKMPQAILLHGDSGCGKTTTARIIARTLMCSNLGDDLRPCDTCMACLAGDAHPDINEMNMADKRGIDDVRALIDSSTNMPTMSKYRIYIIDEVHMWTPQAEQAFLKPLEEPPERTIWILCTTDPQKLKTAILGRLTKLPVRLIEPDVLMKRLAYIAKKEGVDLKEREDGSKILRTIADIANGQMRESIELLTTTLNAIKSGDKLDTKSILQTIMVAGEAEMDKASAYLVASILNGDLKDVVQQIRGVGNSRTLLSKCRWLIQYLLDNSVGLAKYAPYNAKIFSGVAKQNNIKVKLQLLIKMQYLLIEVETKMNTMSLDESVLMLSMVGNFMTTEIKAPKDK